MLISADFGTKEDFVPFNDLDLKDHFSCHNNLYCLIGLLQWEDGGQSSKNHLTSRDNILEVPLENMLYPWFSHL